MSVQQTLTGDEADDRERAGTMLWCPECDDWLLRSRVFDHGHDVPGTPGTGGGVVLEKLTEDDGGGDGAVVEAERVGGVYDIELSYTMDFSFRIVAWNEQQAKEEAELRVEYPENCWDAWLVHSDMSEAGEVFEDDHRIPDDWDPYGNTRLHEVFGEDGGEP